MKYMKWEDAGGPNECAHGYAKGIPCPDCAKPLAAPLSQPDEPTYEELLAENRAWDILCAEHLDTINSLRDQLLKALKAAKRRNL